MHVNHLFRVRLHLHAYLYVKLQTFEISMFLEVSLHEGILLFILVDILQICQVTISDESNSVNSLYSGHCRDLKLVSSLA